MWEYTLKFRMEGKGPPSAIRVRRLLKIALRAFGLRCTHVARARVAAADPPPVEKTARARVRLARGPRAPRGAATLAIGQCPAA